MKQNEIVVAIAAPNNPKCGIKIKFKRIFKAAANPLNTGKTLVLLK